MDSLFDPFVTSKQMGEGLGLGLAIVKSILRDLNGDIQVSHSSLGGACFTIHLPVLTEEEVKTNE